MRFFNIKKLSLRLAHKCQKAKFEKRATLSTAEFYQLSETFYKEMFSSLLKKKMHSQLRYLEAIFKEILQKLVKNIILPNYFLIGLV